MCYLKSCTVHIPKFVLNVFYSWDLRIPLQVSHFCKIQPDVSIKALSSLKFPQYSQRWRVNWVSGGKSHSATSVCIGWINTGRRRSVSQSMERQMQTEEAAQQTC